MLKGQPDNPPELITHEMTAEVRVDRVKSIVGQQAHLQQPRLAARLRGGARIVVQVLFESLEAL